MAKAKQIVNVEQPPVNDPGRAEYRPVEAKPRGNGGEVDANSEPTAKDRVYGVASRDRWPGSDDVSENLRDSRKIEGSDTGSDEEEEEEESEGGASLTVAELKAALDDANVEYPAGAKKADLVELYDANITE